MARPHNPGTAEAVPVWALPRSLAATDGITIVFSSSGYLDVSVPLVCLRLTYVFSSWSLDMTPVGLPHSDISGSKRACRSPKLFAACHVLHRLSVPRHPPSTLSNLTIKCLDLMRSAVESSKSDSSCILFYNPYSIVKELPIAKIDAELYRWMALTADSRGLILRR